MFFVPSIYSGKSPYEESGASEDVKGFKVAHIENLSILSFKGIAGKSYKVSDKFRCKKHKTITHGCNCGFYSFKKITDAFNILNLKRGLVLIKVDHFGEIFEHKDGYISEEQDVVEVFIQNKCSTFFCKDNTSHISFNQRKNTYRQVCNRHKGDISYTLDELKEVLPIKFSIL